MNKTNLIVNYLPQTLTDEEFRSMFLSIGQLKLSKIIRDRGTGYSFGFGFVDFVTEEDATRAIQTLNGLQIQNKRIKVAYARQGEDVKGANLYLCHLPPQMTQEELEETFCQYGQIVKSRILVDQNTGKSKGVGFVLYSKRVEAELAINSLNGSVLPGGTEPVAIKFAEDNKNKARPPIVVVNQGGGNYHQNAGGYNGGGGGGGGGYNNAGYNNGGSSYNSGSQHGYNSGSYGSGGSQQHSGGGYQSGGGGGYGGGGQQRSQNRGYNNYNQGPSQAANQDEGGFVLFVYNIGPAADERELWQLFSPFGTVQKVNVIRDHQKDQGKGYGFVTMAYYQDAMSAIQSLNGYRYTNKPLQVSFKSPRD